MIEADYDRIILSDSHQRNNNLGRKKNYKFGYPSPLVDSSKTTVDVILGGDHGAGAFHLLGKVNYLSISRESPKNGLNMDQESSNLAI